MPLLKKTYTFRWPLLGVALSLVGALLMMTGCQRSEHRLDPLRQARVDALNKEAFAIRYRDPLWGAQLSDSVLRYIADSLPPGAYPDGEARARNIRDFCYYLTSQPLPDSVGPLPKGHNGEVEQAISTLLEARISQRQCDIVSSYELLYDLEHSGVLGQGEEHYLYHFAQSEYYITQLILNYHYRDGSEVEGAELLQEIEQQRQNLRVDYAQDMALNYALAHSYYRLSADTQGTQQQHYLRRALQLVRDNLNILSHPADYCPYQMADAVQLLGFMAQAQDIDSTAWAAVRVETDSIASLLCGVFRFEADTTLPLSLNLLEESASIFLQLDDPYQRLGACVATAACALQVGDTMAAHYYYALALADTAMPLGYAPKFEASLYEGLMRSNFPGTNEDYQLWFDRFTYLRDAIARSQQADFELMRELKQSREKTHHLVILVAVGVALMVALLTLLLLLRRRTAALAREKRLLEEAKRQDVERIANTETCLSVLRHDITPFFSYLQNRNLPEPLREEVLEQLIRTFDNIKHWTTLSAPTGMRFVGGNYAVGSIFAEVESHVVNLNADKVRLLFADSPSTVWGDRLLLVILLRNLVTNALQHTEEGQVRVEVAPFEDNGDFLHFTVSDTGSGMDAREVEELFRSDKRPSLSGHGFGLILSRYIIKQHDDHTLQGCRIWAESRLGEGSVFHFLLAKEQNANTQTINA